MAELTFRSAGVSTREIDLSGPSVTGPQGIPAGVIGTSVGGPAFVPVTFANFSEFVSVFGETDGEKFGPLAVNEWLKNARAVTYLRILGAGDGKKRTSSGVVTNAGFFVGGQQVQDNGLIGDNAYANESASAATVGRTYFLGALMSESNGSTIFSSAGIQNSANAVPILRGVLLAPSGVILHLSGNNNDSDKPGNTDTAIAANGDLIGQKGALTGSLTLASQEFVMLLNGYKGTSAKPTAITASFDMTATNYFGNVLNKDPLKLESEGHLLYGQYDIYPTLATVTGSGAITAGAYSKGVGDSSKEDIALLLTSSVVSSLADSSVSYGNVPDYEDFKDRFTTAKSPYVISQRFGNSPYSLFRVHALSDGEGPATQYKISIENLRNSTSDINKFGTFDLVVRRFDDTDDEKVVLESFRGLSLDPGADRFVGRAIGDQHIFFNFDNDEESQKIVVDGTHPVRSRFIRVELSDALKKKEVPDEALPFGFRGLTHLVTSGSFLAPQVDSLYASTDLTQRIVEPPVPYRDNLAIGTGLNKRVDSRLYWGLQSTRKTSITEPNKTGLFDDSLITYVKHFPEHRIDTTGFAVGNNPGAANINGGVVDCDLFNYNQFSLEKIQVRTGSDGYADAEYWVSASLVRNATSDISANAANKTRGFRVSDLDRVANRRFAKFTFPLQGGFNGTNIFDVDQYKLTNTAAKREIDDEANQGGRFGSTVASFRKAVDIMGSKTDVDIQLLAIPGMRHTSITDYAIQAVENRFDAMYIMDIEERDQVNTVITSSTQTPHVLNTVNDFKNRVLDTSFAAAYFPNVTIADPTTNGLVEVPPSVAVLGAFSQNDRIGHPWYAPAGFTRGGLDAVEMTNVRLNRANLDDLYDADVNPITAFPGTGITVWGQKTLLQSQSALDRINVRRLLIDVRRKVRNVANTLLFEPNRTETLEKFSALVNPILQRVQEQSGVDRYKVVIDTTTTTQADIENNTIRGKIFLQPTRTVEFVSLDFVVTNAGSPLL
jgi:phage tail sheath protein FI